MYKIGEGFDIHRLVSGRELIIGGIVVPHDRGSLAHSDGDVLIHAIVDAILGALAKGDIGRHFPDSDIKYKDISSAIFLQEMASLLKSEKFRIINIDSTVILERPKLSPFIPKMVERIGSLLEIENNAVNIKAKTNEGMSDIGEGNAISAKAVVLICDENNDN